MRFEPCLKQVMEGGELRSIVLGHRVLDDYLEFVAARGAKNTWLATAYDLKVFFEVDGLLRALRTHRDRAMVLAMLLGGLRRCEVLGLRLCDVNVGERRVHIMCGKGGRERIVPVSGRFFAALSDYLELERPADAVTE